MKNLIKRLMAIAALLAVFFVWLAETLLTPHGLYRLLVTLIAQPFKRLRGYAFDLWLASDQYINATFGGTVDTTISGRVGFYASQGREGYILAEKVIDTIFWLAVRQRGHCRSSIEPDETH
jgi:hypothetical protein